MYFFSKKTKENFNNENPKRGYVASKSQLIDETKSITT